MQQTPDRRSALASDGEELPRATVSGFLGAQRRSRTHLDAVLMADISGTLQRRLRRRFLDTPLLLISRFAAARGHRDRHRLASTVVVLMPLP